MKKRSKVGNYKPRKEHVEKLRVFLAKLNTEKDVK